MSDERRGRSRRGKSPDREPAKDPHGARERERYESPIASREFIITTLREEKGPLDLEALTRRLGLVNDDDGREALRRRVAAMLRDGQLVENRKQGLVPVDADALIAGRISAHKDGFGFLIPDEGGDDVFLNGKQMRQVLHGDRAIVSVTGTDRRGRREGRIVDVVERANRSLVGRLVIEHGVAFVSPDNKRIHQDLMIQPGELAGAVGGVMVVAEIVEQPTMRQPPVGRVVEVLGEHLDAGMEIDVALRSAGIPSEWPDAVVDEAQRFSPEVEESAKVGRKDVRDLPLVTIDGADARDFDDAVWCEKSGKGWRLLVAIADVAHYVRPGAPLDAEAIERGTSVYFPGRVVPMLPEILSNGLCSLNPDVDRLCMLCELTLDERGSLRRARFFNGVMRSHARFTYDQVNEILTRLESPLRTEHATLVPMLEEMRSLYKALAKSRRRRGAIEFESTETRIVFDENRKISELVPVVRNDAHKLIEECMILANIAAAAILEKHEMPALYRVHMGPKADRLEDLRSFLALRGLALGGGDKPSGLDYAKLARDIEDLPDRHVVQTVMLRSMQQAVYQPKNEGHFGLALQQYAHFTSPIRRYPDLLVHRGIKHVLTRRPSSDYRYSMHDMQMLGESCSMTERRAEEASRDVVAWLKCEYMLDHVGDEFEGTVTAVTSFGLFVELGGVHVEGLIHITNLSHDYYRYDAASHSLVGERTGRTYRLGDPMVVVVNAVNLDERKIDFGEVSHRSAGRVGKKGDKGGKGDKGRKRNESAGADAEVAFPAEGVAADADKPRKGKKKHRKRERAHEAAPEREGVPADGTQASVPASTPEPSTFPSDTSGTAADVLEPGGPAATSAVLDTSAPGETESPVRSAAEGSSAAAHVPEAVNTPETTASPEPTDSSPRPDAPVEQGAPAASETQEGAVAEQAEAKVPSGKKAAGKKVAAKKTTAKTTAVKKTAAKKTATKKAAARKVAAKKVTAKKAAGKKATSKKKAVAKTSASKKATGKKAVSKKAVSKKASAGKSSAGKAAAESGDAPSDDPLAEHPSDD